MCGITGWVDWERDLREWRRTAEVMTSTLAARGPDAAGAWFSRHAFLGHRRLSVIDLDRGGQPMAASADGHPVVLSYSGEVYNYRELREELCRAGHEFGTSSDTEVVLRGYLQWGTELFPRLNGIYAFAVWDAREDLLLLVRDRLGVKPLYYYPTGQGAIFGSEPKAMLANPFVPARLGGSGIAELFELSTAPTPGHGLLEGFAQVLPGHYVRVTHFGVTESQYWTLEARPHEDDAVTTVRHVRELLQDIVQRQLVADVPLGALLSGGVDSSAIAALAAATMRADGGDSKLSTYSVDFPRIGEFKPTAWHDSLDEPFALEAARHIGAQHTTVLLTGGDVEDDERVVLRARDLPGWGELDISLYRLFARVREHTTVALTGESADELFGGYPFFHDDRAIAFDGFPWLVAGRDGPSVLLRPDVAARVRPAEYARQRYREAVDDIPRLDRESDADHAIRRVGWLTLSRFLPTLLDRKDRMSMAVGLEARVPFCDHRLVEYVWNVPWSMRNSGGNRKGLLREAVADMLPPSVAYRKKSAFPLNPDPSYAEYLRARMEGLLASGDAPVFEIVDRATVRAYFERGEPLPSPRGTGRHADGFGFLVNVDDWLREYDLSVV